MKYFLFIEFPLSLSLPFTSVFLLLYFLSLSLVLFFKRAGLSQLKRVPTRFSSIFVLFGGFSLSLFLPFLRLRLFVEARIARVHSCRAPKLSGSEWSE